MNEGIVVTFMSSQTRVQLIAPTPSFTGDTSSDMSRLDEFVIGGTSLTTLETEPTTNIRDVLIGFDQTVTDVEPVVRPVSGFSTMSTHLAALESSVLLVLHG